MNFIDRTTLKYLLYKCRQIVASNVSWEEKFKLIFSEDISRRVFKITSIDYHDPDTSYEEDVMAFVGALEKKVMDIVCAEVVENNHGG